MNKNEYEVFQAIFRLREDIRGDGTTLLQRLHSWLIDKEQQDFENKKQKKLEFARRQLFDLKSEISNNGDSPSLTRTLLHLEEMVSKIESTPFQPGHLGMVSSWEILEKELVRIARKRDKVCEPIEEAAWKWLIPITKIEAST